VLRLPPASRKSVLFFAASLASGLFGVAGCVLATGVDDLVMCSLTCDGGAEASTTGDARPPLAADTGHERSADAALDAVLDSSLADEAESGSTPAAEAGADARAGPTTIYAGAAALDGIAQVAAHVFVTSETADLVLKIPKTGGAPVSVGPPQQSPYAVDVDGTTIYWTNGGTAPAFGDGAVLSCLRGGALPCAPVSLARAQAGPLAPMALDAANVYWLDVFSGSVMGVAKAGGVPWVLASGQSHLSGVSASAGRVYWSTHDDVWSSSPDGGAVQALANGRPSPQAIVADAANAYWVEAGPAGSVLQCALAGCAGQPIVIASSQDSPVWVAVDAGFIYWVANGTGHADGAILKAPIGGGSILTLAASQNDPRSLAVDDMYAFWTTGAGTVNRTTK
jgi:hypothetical protein